MRVIEWLYRHAGWLNLAALVALVLWGAGIGSILLHLSAPAAPQLEVLRACPCQAPATGQPAANRN